MSIVVKSNVRHRHPKRESKKTGFTEFLEYQVCSCQSELVRARSRDFVSLNIKRLCLRSRRGCCGSEASNWQYIENIRLERRSNQGCQKTSRERAGNWVFSEKKGKNKKLHNNDMEMSIAQKHAQARVA